MEREIEEERERRCEVEEDRDGEENWRKEKRREEEGRRLREKDLDMEYYRKDLCRRFIAHTGGIIDIHPPLLTLRMFEMRIPQNTRWKRDGTIRKNGRLAARPWIPWRRQFIWLEEFERGVLARFVREGERDFAGKRDFAKARESKKRELKARELKARESRERESKEQESITNIYQK